MLAHTLEPGKRCPYMFPGLLHEVSCFSLRGLGSWLVLRCLAEPQAALPAQIGNCSVPAEAEAEAARAELAEQALAHVRRAGVGAWTGGEFRGKAAADAGVAAGSAAAHDGVGSGAVGDAGQWRRRLGS